MSRPAKYDWPEDKDLQELLDKLGTVAAAKSLGIPPTSLSNRINSRGLRGSKKRQQLAVGEQPIDDPQRIKLDQQDAEIKALRKEVKEYSEERASRQQFLEEVAEACKRRVSMRKIKAKTRPKGLPKRTAITPVYDVQYGQQVRPEDTPGGRGAYSTAIFDARAQRWFEGVTGNMRDYADSHDITDLVIPLGGDFVEGHGIFAGQEWQLELDPFEQTWQFACKFGGDERSDLPGLLPELITFAKKEIGVRRIRIYVVPGNHGKPGGRKAGALHTTHSFDWLVGMLIRDKLAGLPIDEFAIEPGGALYFEAAKHVFLMKHGDEIRGWGGIPFYGLARHDGKAVRQGQIIHDYLLIGDKHIPAELDQGGGGETLMQPAWVGENNLSRELGAAARPGQRIYFVSEKWGITESARIQFEEATVQRAPSHVHGRRA